MDLFTLLKKDLELVLAEGEGYLVEFKESVSRLDREIVAFANAAGGCIYLGVRDDGSIKGISVSNKLKSQLQDIAYNCDPAIKIELKHFSTFNVLAVIVHEGQDKPYRCKDGFFFRNGPSTQRMKRNEILALVMRSPKVHYDEAINPCFNYPKDFSKQRFTEYLTLCGIQVKASDSDILLSLNCAQEENNQLKLGLTH